MANKQTDSVGCLQSDIPEIALAYKFWRFGPAFERWATAQIPQQLPVKRLTPQRVRLLSILMDEGPCIMAALRDGMGVTATNITVLVDALEKDGLVTRRPHPSDRRATIIELTGKALEEMNLNRTECETRIGSLFGILAPEEQTFLLAIMDKLEKHLEQAKTA